MFTNTSAQNDQLQRDGYLKFETAAPQADIMRWHGIADTLQSEALERYASGSQMHGACVIEDPVGARLMRVDNLLYHAADAILDLMACSAMMAIARDFCGPTCIPVQSDILYKHQHPHPVISWHQGPQHARTHPYFNIGIYLDHAPENDGCLRYVPGTQFEQQDIYTIANAHGWNPPGCVQLPAAPGDILVQDMMILHGSEPKRSPGARRTIYVEYWSSDAVREAGLHSEEWIALRQQWMAHIIDRAAPGDWPEDWKPNLPDLMDPMDLAKAISDLSEPVLPAHYGYPVAETDNYPVPSDLRRA